MRESDVAGPGWSLLGDSGLGLGELLWLLGSSLLSLESVTSLVEDQVINIVDSVVRAVSVTGFHLLSTAAVWWNQHVQYGTSVTIFQ